MNYLEKVSNELDLRRIGTWTCLIAMLALCIGIVTWLSGSWKACEYTTPSFFDICFEIMFFLSFQIAIPLVALWLFRRTGKIGQVHAAALMVPYIILSLLFWSFIPGETDKDSLGALAFVFGPIYISIICCVFLTTFSTIYLIYRKLKKNSARDKTEFF